MFFPAHFSAPSFWNDLLKWDNPVPNKVCPGPRPSSHPAPMPPTAASITAAGNPRTPSSSHRRITRSDIVLALFQRSNCLCRRHVCDSKLKPLYVPASIDVETSPLLSLFSRTTIDSDRIQQPTPHPSSPSRQQNVQPVVRFFVDCNGMHNLTVLHDLYVNNALTQALHIQTPIFDGSNVQHRNWTYLATDLESLT
ncbi:unnamed protein product [Cyclocybe aegerita]|uniref:Uncharacterized protein n=1 Tax=Cyclocybe aegerita TaxID=1973307 RepID=A0A8S0XKN6_CYCAE|nr:unnamed protein product [Cyclocybe aegerita]